MCSGWLGVLPDQFARDRDPVARNYAGILGLNLVLGQTWG